MERAGAFSFGSLLNASRGAEESFADVHAQGAVQPSEGMWLVAGYEVASQVLRDHTNLSSNITMGFGGSFGRTMVFVDPPDHTRLRGIVAKPFTPRNLAAWEPRIRELTRRLLDAMKPGEPFDLMSGLARPLPVIVIAEMMGLDTDALDPAKWTDPAANMLQMMSMTRGSGDSSGLFSNAIEQRRGARREDLVGLLVSALEDGVIDEAELMGSCALLFVAGNVTTTSLLGNAALALSAHPDQCREIAADRSLIPNAIEEVFRYDPPVPAIPPRRTLAPTMLGGIEAPEGTSVIVYAAAANRDPDRFGDPDRFDIHRPDAPHHLAFGAGIHYCLGAPLSRLEARVALEELLERTPVLELAIPREQASYDGSSFLRAPRHVPLVV